MFRRESATTVLGFVQQVGQDVDFDEGGGSIVITVVVRVRCSGRDVVDGGGD